MRKRCCDKCGSPFQPMRDHQRFCSRECRLWARSSRRQMQRHEERSIRQRAEWKAAMDGIAGTTCAICGTLFAAARSTARYCTDKCRLRAHRQRTPSVAQIQARMSRDLRHLDRLARATRVRRSEQ
jgi:hypothetical protein